MLQNQPKIIIGDKHEESRDKLEFYNNFDMSVIKRIYFTTDYDINTVRAWQGHTIESRWFVYIKGSFNIKLIKIDNWENPSLNLPIENYILSQYSQEVLYVPKEYVNGFKAQEKDSKPMIMSNYGFNEIENDQVRFDQNKWKNGK